MAPAWGLLDGVEMDAALPRDTSNKVNTSAVQVKFLLTPARQLGSHAWGDMAVICRHHAVMDECASALARRKLPYQVRKATGSFKPNADTIKVLTMHASKGLEFAVVALPGVGQMPAPGDDEQEEGRLFYVAATQVTQRLVITASGDGEFGRWLR